MTPEAIQSPVRSKGQTTQLGVGQKRSSKRLRTNWRLRFEGGTSTNLTMSPRLHLRSNDRIVELNASEMNGKENETLLELSPLCEPCRLEGGLP